MNLPRTRNSLLCPNCRRLVSRDAPNCPFCGLKRPGSWLKNNPLFAAFANENQFVRIIICVNIVMFVFSLLFTRHGPSFSLNPFDFLAPSNRSLLVLGATVQCRFFGCNAGGRFWRPIICTAALCISSLI